MGDARRRRLNGSAPRTAREPKAQAAPVMPAGLLNVTMQIGRKEETVDGKGIITRRLALHIFLSDGTQLTDDGPRGPQPVEIMTEPIIVGRTIVVSL